MVYISGCEPIFPLEIPIRKYDNKGKNTLHQKDANILHNLKISWLNESFGIHPQPKFKTLSHTSTLNFIPSDTQIYSSLQASPRKRGKKQAQGN